MPPREEACSLALDIVLTFRPRGPLQRDPEAWVRNVVYARVLETWSRKEPLKPSLEMWLENLVQSNKSSGAETWLRNVGWKRSLKDEPTRVCKGSTGS